MKTRKTYLDVMRILAIVLVLFNHLPGYNAYQTESGVGQALCMMLSIVTCINVPLFGMISGVLLMGREESIGDLWRKRICRMLTVVLVFELLTYIEFHYTRDYDISVQGFLYGMFGGTLKNFTSYWFLYAYIGFLIMLPFLRRMMRLISRQEMMWLMGIHVLFTTVVPLVSFACQQAGLPQFNAESHLHIALSNTTLFFFPVIGYWIDRNVDVRKLGKGTWTLVAGTALMGIALCMAMTYQEHYMTDKMVNKYFGLTNYVTTIATFLVLKRLSYTRLFANRWTVAASGTIAPLIFGVYLMDQALKLVLYEPMNDAISGAMLLSVAWIATAIVLLGAATYILRQIPYVNKLL